MNVFLRMKHWQLFATLFGVPFVLQIIGMGSVIAAQDPTVMFTTFPILMIFFIVVYFGWFYALGTNLHGKLPSTVKMNLTRFKIFMVIPIVYMVALGFAMFGFVQNLRESSELRPEGMFGAFAIIFPLHLFSMFCIFHSLWFNAKSLKSVEWQKPVTFSDYAGEFFLIWFFPIGVWFIQPRINRLFDERLQQPTEQTETNA